MWRLDPPEVASPGAAVRVSDLVGGRCVLEEGLATGGVYYRMELIKYRECLTEWFVWR